MTTKKILIMFAAAAGVAVTVLIVRGLAPELYRYLKIKRM